jgi:hypothetical protein
LKPERRFRRFQGIGQGGIRRLGRDLAARPADVRPGPGWIEQQQAGAESEKQACDMDRACDGWRKKIKNRLDRDNAE